MIERIPYGGRYPVGLKALLETRLVKSVPRQKERTTRSTQGVDVTYTLNWSPEELDKHLDELLLAVYQDMLRYESAYPRVKFWAQVEYKVSGEGGLKAISAHSGEAEVVVYGPGYEVAQYSLKDILENIRDLIKKYPKKRKEVPVFSLRRVWFRAYEEV